MKRKLKNITKWIGSRLQRNYFVCFDLATPCGNSNRSIRIKYWKYRWITLATWKNGEMKSLESFCEDWLGAYFGY